VKAQQRVACTAHEFAETSQPMVGDAHERGARAHALALKAQAICLFRGRDSLRAPAYATMRTHMRPRPAKKTDARRF
jgi:hypothetical protein